MSVTSKSLLMVKSMATNDHSNVAEPSMEYLHGVRIVVAFENGRIGNQLFQYAAVKRYVPSAHLLNVGMDSLSSWLCHIDTVKDSIWTKIALKVLRRLGRMRILRVAGKGRLFSIISERYDRGQCYVNLEKGLIPGIAFLNGFFQAEKVLDGLDTTTLAIDKTLLRAARGRIDCFADMSRIHSYFVHVHRGDYTSWPSRNAPAVLSASWYLAQIKRIQAQDPRASFFVFSDDLPYVHEQLGGAGNVFICSGSELADLAAMSQCCGGGIMSASTFAWWGAFYSKRNNPNALFLAPRFWAGWREDRWYPPSIETSWIQYVDAF
jgi:hypothetical protein